MQKIKRFWESNYGKDILIVVIVILTGTSSFYLGRLSHQSSQKGLKIEYQAKESSVLETKPVNLSPNPNTVEKANNQALGKYFASKIGKKYYSIGCSAGKNIKQENRIYFNSISEAEKAGYEASTSCR